MRYRIVAVLALFVAFQDVEALVGVKPLGDPGRTLFQGRAEHLA